MLNCCGSFSAMAKLYFRYGTMGSAKSLNLLAVAHNYQQQGKKVVLLKPAMDTRWGKDIIKSRAGLEKLADIMVEPNTILNYSEFEGISCVLVDEAQFMSEFVVNQLRALTIDLKIPVICYGLRTDFRTQLFEGSKRLLELADTVEEIKTTCNFCNNKAVFNMKFVNGVPSLDGPAIELGAEEKYLAVCHKHYYEKLNNKTSSQTFDFSIDADI